MGKKTVKGRMFGRKRLRLLMLVVSLSFVVVGFQQCSEDHQEPVEQSVIKDVDVGLPQPVDDGDEKYYSSLQEMLGDDGKIIDFLPLVIILVIVMMVFGAFFRAFRMLRY